MKMKELEQKWAHQDSNLGPTGYEPVALPTELWARGKQPGTPSGVPGCQQCAST